MSIKDQVIEFHKLDQEILLLQKEIKKLRERKNKLGTRIQEYLHENDLPGIRYKNVNIIPKTRKQRKPLNKQTKQKVANQYLERFGVSLSTKQLEELLETMRGEARETNELKIIR